MTLSESPSLSVHDLLQALNPYTIPSHHSVSRNAYWFRSGSEALAETIRAMRPSFVWFPAFFCQESLRYVRRLSTPLGFYDIDEGFEPDWGRATRAVNDLFVVAHYFGFPIVTPSSLHIIEDGAHMMPGTIECRSAALIFSPRKFFPVPNGGLVLTKHRLPQSYAEDDPRGLVTWTAKQFIRKVPLPWHWLPQYWNPPLDTTEGMTVGRIIRLLTYHFEQERESIAATRRRNYLKLLPYCVDSKKLRPYFTSLAADACPYVLPVYVHRYAHEFTYNLRSQGIPAALWPGRAWNKPCAIDKKQFPVSADLAEHTVLLPIHQGLREEDMERIGKALC